jgi:pyruvate/2-oxoglutarate dehydrogenase complex dihydrolipoamide acyltransferase (E2) component
MRPIGLLALTFDARVVDLAMANAFLADIQGRLEWRVSCSAVRG